MKKKFSFAAIAAIFVLFSCKKSDGGSTSTQTTESTEIMPTTIGTAWRIGVTNFWEGEGGSTYQETYYDTATIMGTRKIDNEVYHVVHIGFPSDNTVDSFFFRNTSNSLIEINRGYGWQPFTSLAKPTSTITYVNAFPFQTTADSYKDWFYTYPGTTKIDGVDCYKNIIYYVSSRNNKDTLSKYIKYFKMGFGKVVDSFYWYNYLTREPYLNEVKTYIKIK